GGRAPAAHIHMGRGGEAGPVVGPVCGPCGNGQTGKVHISKAVVSALEAGNAYVNVHTPKNAAGEIRGQVKVRGQPPKPPRCEGRAGALPSVHTPLNVSGCSSPPLLPWPAPPSRPAARPARAARSPT